MAWEVGHREGAKQASVKSRNMGIAAVFTGIAFVLIVVIVGVANYVQHVNIRY